MNCERFPTCSEAATVHFCIFSFLTTTQDEAIPLILGGGDVMVAAETGSGKTAAFSLPLLQIVQEDLRGRLSGSARSAARQSGRKSESSCRISRIEKDGQMVVSVDGLSCQCEESKWAGARGEVGVRGGVHCFEVRRFMTMISHRMIRPTKLANVVNRCSTRREKLVVVSERAGCKAGAEDADVGLIFVEKRQKWYAKP